MTVSRDFDPAYVGVPPWDIGRPQAEVERLERRGFFTGRVLDVGCGTGENALYLAARGHDVTGVDASRRAIAKARAKAEQRDVEAGFAVGDALALPDAVDGAFDSVLDCGLFHVFDDEERPRYVRSLGAVLRPGGRLVVLCFSDKEPDWGGPRRVSKAELRAAFARDWLIEAIEPAEFATNLPQAASKAWRAEFVRTS